MLKLTLAQLVTTWNLQVSEITTLQYTNSKHLLRLSGLFPNLPLYPCCTAEGGRGGGKGRGRGGGWKAC